MAGDIRIRRSCTVDAEKQGEEQIGGRHVETIQAIRGRRSIRRFRQEPVSREDLTEIVRAGSLAATGGNRQNWRFIAVHEGGKVAATTAALGWLNGWRPGEEEGPVAHVVALVPSGASRSVALDCAAAIQNMLLAAWDRGIGSCWFGSVKRDQLAGELAVPDGWEILAVVALGHAAEAAEVIESSDARVTRDESDKVRVPKKPLESILTFDGF
jgi:nitroreductase